MSSSEDADAFRASLKQRAEAAKGLERDLLTEVPQLYGSPDRLAPNGDPGIALARIHRDEMQRRNGGGVPVSTSKRTDATLPFERTLYVFAIIFLVLVFFLK